MVARVPEYLAEPGWTWARALERAWLWELQHNIQDIVIPPL